MSDMEDAARASESIWRRIYELTYVLYRRHRTQVNTLLAFLLIVGLLAYLLLVWYTPADLRFGAYGVVSSRVAAHLPTLAQLAAVTRDVLSILAIFVAAIWGWYSFVRTRAFYPKATIDVVPFGVLDGQGAKILVLRCDILNDGKVKLSPRRITAECYAARTRDGRLRYEQLDERTDVLEECTQIKNARLNLEPQSHLRFDCEVSLKGLITEVAEPVVLVRLILADNNFFMWERRKLVFLKDLIGEPK